MEGHSFRSSVKKDDNQAFPDTIMSGVCEIEMGFLNSVAFF